MKAIIRSSAGLLGLLVLTLPAFAQDRIWVSAALRQPLPYAPSPSNSSFFYVVNSYGMMYGPNYYLTPPCQPFNGILPGPIGNAIMSGNLPHALLLSKEAMTIGDAPLLGKRGPNGPPAAPAAPMANMAPMNAGPMPYAPPPPYPPMMGRPYFMQMPYGGVPTSPFPMQSPYAMPVPAPAPPPMGRPIAYVPYVGPPGMYQLASRNPQTGVWQVQNVMPGQAAPFAPIPGFRPPPPGSDPALEQFGPVQPFDPFGQMQGPQPPQMNWQGMQLPRMEGHGPPPPPRGMPYPTHPFTRSPRDFFMWGEAMEEERARGNRPFPVP